MPSLSLNKQRFISISHSFSPFCIKQKVLNNFFLFSIFLMKFHLIFVALWGIYKQFEGFAYEVGRDYARFFFGDAWILIWNIQIFSGNWIEVGFSPKETFSIQINENSLIKLPNKKQISFPQNFLALIKFEYIIIL